MKSKLMIKQAFSCILIIVIMITMFIPVLALDINVAESDVLLENNMNGISDEVILIDEENVTLETEINNNTSEIENNNLIESNVNNISESTEKEIVEEQTKVVSYDFRSITAEEVSDEDFEAEYYTSFVMSIAKATNILPPGSTSTDLQLAINSATSGDTIQISDDMTFLGTVVIPLGKTITIESTAGNNWILTKTTSGSHFNIGGHLILQNIVVDGKTTGGSIYVGNTGNFTMNAGTVIQNCNNSGVTNLGTFIMNDGTIKNNTGSSQGYGGGVYNVASFTMNGGSIIENSARNGGGINNTGTVTINNGTISNNHATLYGGGITVNLLSSCTMYNGTISNNLSDATSARHSCSWKIYNVKWEY